MSVLHFNKRSVERVEVGRGQSWAAMIVRMRGRNSARKPFPEHSCAPSTCLAAEHSRVR